MQPVGRNRRSMSRGKRPCLPIAGVTGLPSPSPDVAEAEARSWPSTQTDQIRSSSGTHGSGPNVMPYSSHGRPPSSDRCCRAPRPGRAMNEDFLAYGGPWPSVPASSRASPVCAMVARCTSRSTRATSRAGEGRDVGHVFGWSDVAALCDDCQTVRRPPPVPGPRVPAHRSRLPARGRFPSHGRGRSDPRVPYRPGPPGLPRRGRRLTPRFDPDDPTWLHFQARLADHPCTCRRHHPSPDRRARTRVRRRCRRTGRSA
jgi:hypothetical protein